MAHDGQDPSLTEADSVLLDNLLSLTRDAIGPTEAFLATAKDRVLAMVSANGRVSGGLIEANQTAAHGLAWIATYVESLRQMQAWADALSEKGKFGEVEALIHQIAFGE